MSDDLPTREDFLVLRTVQTRWGDEDVYGHVNNVVHYAYFDTAVNAQMMAATGLDIRSLEAVGVVAETGCRYLRELHFPGDVEVGIAVERLGRSSIAYALGLFQGPEPEPAALGHFVHVYVDATTREVAPVPEVVRLAVAPLVRTATTTSDSPVRLG